MSLDRKVFSRLRIRDEKKGLLLAWKESIRTFMEYRKNKAYTARELSQLLGIDIDDVYAVLHDLSYRNLTRKGIYFIWGK